MPTFSDGFHNLPPSSGSNQSVAVISGDRVQCLVGLIAIFGIWIGTVAAQAPVSLQVPVLADLEIYFPPFVYVAV